MANEMMSLNINKEMLTPVIEQQVKLMMTEILGGRDALIDKIIKSALEMKVDEKGRPSNCSYDKPLFQYLFTEEIKKAVTEVIKEEVAGSSEAIKASLRRVLVSKRGSDKMAQALMDGILKSFEDNWCSKFEVSFVKRSNDNDW